MLHILDLTLSFSPSFPFHNPSESSVFLSTCSAALSLLSSLLSCSSASSSLLIILCSSLVSYLQTSSNPPSHSLTLVNPVTLLISFTLLFLDLSLYLVSLSLFLQSASNSHLCSLSLSLSVRLIVVGCARASTRMSPARLCCFWENGGTERRCRLTTEGWIDRRWRRVRQLYSSSRNISAQSFLQLSVFS